MASVDTSGTQQCGSGGQPNERILADAARAKRLAGIQRRLQTQRRKVRERQYSRHLGKVVRVLRRVLADFFAVEGSQQAQEHDRGVARQSLRCCCRTLKDTLDDPDLTLWDHRLALTEFDSFRHLLSASPPIPFVRGNELEHTCNFDADLQLLRSRGWSRLTGVFPPDVIAKARGEVLGPEATAMMRWQYPLNPSSYRDDKIIWLNRAHAFSPSSRNARGSKNPGLGTTGGDCCQYVPRLLQRLMRGILRIRTAVSKVVQLQSERVEFQLAQYSPASNGYVRHLDSDNPDDRRVTIIVYLNDADWSASADGGQLRIWEPSPAAASSTVDYNPAGDGSAIVFLSCAIAHQVRPIQSSRCRLALTAWCY